MGIASGPAAESFEKTGTRSPAGIRPGPWMVDDPIGSTWGYTTGMTVSAPAAILGKIIDTVSKGGFYLLNISQMADGTIPQAQQTTRLGIGAWFAQNGEAIYGTRPWTKFGEGNTRFTTKGDTLYAITLDWPASGEITLTSLATAVRKITKVELLGSKGGPLEFTQTDAGLKVKLPAQKTGEAAWSLKITGLKL